MDYKTDAINILLNEDCILQRYYPLIPYKDVLIKNLLENHYYSKKEIANIPDEILMELGLPNSEAVKLFRSFLGLYDIRESKLKEINDVTSDNTEQASFRELYLLPGIKAARAKLYFDADYKTLGRIAIATPEQIIDDTSKVILRKGLPLKAPFPKEVKTHIAVAKVLTQYAV